MILTTILCSPIALMRRRQLGFSSSVVDHPPPPVEANNEWAFGPYSWKAVVEATDNSGEVERTFIGFSSHMNIGKRTEDACDRFKKYGTECGEAKIILKGGECDEIIYMQTKQGALIPLNR